MSSESESLSQRTAFHTAGSHKPIEVKQQSLARVAQIMGAVGQENEAKNSNEDENDYDGDEIDDDLVFSTVPQRSTISSTAQIHFDEIDDEEMRRFAESFEQEQQDVQMNEGDEDEQLCEDYRKKMQTPTKSQQKKGGLEDLDALLNENDEDEDEKNDDDNEMEQHQMSPVFKKKP